MSQQMTEAMKSAKTIQQEMVQWENRMESMKNEHENLRRRNELLSQEIEQKTKDFESFVTSRKLAQNAASAKLVEDQRALEAKHAEFAAMLEVHGREKALLEQNKAEFEREKVKVNGQKANIDGFIQAVRRAYSLVS